MALRRLLILLLLSCTALLAQTPGISLRLPALFSDHALIQADLPVSIWGWAAASQDVTVTWMGVSVHTSATTTGTWQLWLPPIPAGRHGDLQVTSNEQTIEVHDVLVGELWLASGQSNMERSLHFSENRSAIEAQAARAGFRFFVVAHQVADSPAEDVHGHWLIADEKNVDNFSATATSFAIQLHERRHVPVGVIDSSFGGTRMLAWINQSVLDTDPRQHWIIDEWRKTTAEFPAKHAAWEEATNHWLDTLSPSDRLLAKKGTALNGRPAEPLGPGSKAQPAGLYNGMVAPLTRSTLRGILWYQGENDALDDLSTYRYRDLFQSMVLSWRQAFADRALPFVFVQVSRYHWPSYALLRESQAKALELANTAMVVSLDQGMIEDVHYPNKEPIGERLELAAEQLAYGEAAAYIPLQPQRLTQENSSLRVWFNPAHVTPQLRTNTIPFFAVSDALNTSAPHVVDGRAVLEREPTAEEQNNAAQIAGEDGLFHPATIRIEGNTAVFTSVAVLHPTQLCYAWSDSAPSLPLWSPSGLPITPFRMALDPTVEPRCPPGPLWKPKP